jgi:hypothetical protein
LPINLSKGSWLVTQSSTRLPICTSSMSMRTV